MKFETGTHVRTSMSSLRGYVNANFWDLVEKFGEPTYNESFGEDKVDVEWCIEFDDGTIATIYNWKDYDGGQRCRSDVNYRWHIGGFSNQAVDAVQAVVGGF